MPASGGAAGEVSTTRPYSTTMISDLAGLKPAIDRPSSLADLKAIQDRVETIARHAMPAIVNLVVADGQGSGIIVSKDGYVLTAGHVSGLPNQRVQVRLSNGTVVEGKSLGMNDLMDSGMVKITTGGDYAFMPVGTIKDVQQGQWVMAMGHPGGFQAGRPPVVRLGKVLNIEAQKGEWFVQSDCPLIMGDSGGPLFDLNGYVIGINSKIGRATTSNVHVPIDTYTQTWERLARGDKWGLDIMSLVGQSEGAPATAPAATLSVVANDDPAGVVITKVKPDKACDKAGVAAEDVITKINNIVVKNLRDLSAELSKHKPGEPVSLELLRKDGGGKSTTLVKKVVLDAVDGK